MVNDADSVPSSGFCDSGERLVQFVLRGVFHEEQVVRRSLNLLVVGLFNHVHILLFTSPLHLLWWWWWW